MITNEDTNQKAGVLGAYAMAEKVWEIPDKSVLKKVADTCNLTAGCCKKLSREEVLEILEECW